MNQRLAATILALTVTGCGTVTAVAPGPTEGKIYLTKTYYFWVFADTHQVQVCNIAGSTLSGCEELRPRRH